MTDKDVIEELRIAVFYDPTTSTVVRQLGQRKVESDDELQTLIRQGHEDYIRLNKPDTPVIIDADARVPWREVVNIMNLIKREKIDKIEFAMGKAFQ
jgi:biopolymer transport protein ExbD